MRLSHIGPCGIWQALWLPWCKACHASGTPLLCPAPLSARSSFKLQERGGPGGFRTGWLYGSQGPTRCDTRDDGGTRTPEATQEATRRTRGFGKKGGSDRERSRAFAGGRGERELIRAVPALLRRKGAQKVGDPRPTAMG